ncbi:MAG: hypothetical protein DRG09_01775 [Epsilonproteobacteria bacterium]|nr:MAG: hypothetical protein DRG09_01775 [Campylobacterota bacterium]
MYYLLNQTNQIIAADESLLALCEVSHIDELSSKIILGDTTFDPVSEDQIIINNDQTYTISKTSLSSMLGDLTLVNVALADSIKTDSELSELLDEDNFLDDITIGDTIEENLDEIAPLDLDLDADLLSIKPDSDEETFSFRDEPESDELDIEDLLLPETEVSISPENNEDIQINIEKISQEMGVSHEDYNAFLDEYIDTALELETDLQSKEEEKRENAVSTLSQLGDVLRLPVIDTIIKKLSTAPTNTHKGLIASFYSTLSRLTTQTDKEEAVEEETEDISLELFDMPLEKVKTIEEMKAAKNVNTNSFGTISLDGIKPIHFDFQLEEAANDLSLPVELIEEFVHDFIEQAHIETKNMLEAYENGDLDAIQKIGHLLKGASSNLRINALSDTLYQIQFCEDSSNLETFIKEYWGHFLSFEIQINALAK